MEAGLIKMSFQFNCVGIIGLGYVGLPLSLDFCDAGLKVIGFDIDENKVAKINNLESYISYISSDSINSYIEADLFDATTDFSRLEEVETIIIAVPTPYISKIEGMRNYPGFELESVELSESIISKQDCLLIITDHSCLDYDWILRHSKLIVDTRNVIKSTLGAKVAKA